MTQSQNPISVQPADNHNESMISIENTPLTSKKESKDDLRKYVKMVSGELEEDSVMRIFC